MDGAFPIFSKQGYFWTLSRLLPKVHFVEVVGSLGLNRRVCELVDKLFKNTGEADSVTAMSLYLHVLKMGINYSLYLAEL